MGSLLPKFHVKPPFIAWKTTPAKISKTFAGLLAGSWGWYFPVSSCIALLEHDRYSILWNCFVVTLESRVMQILLPKFHHSCQTFLQQRLHQELTCKCTQGEYFWQLRVVFPGQWLHCIFGTACRRYSIFLWNCFCNPWKSRWLEL